MCYCLNLSLSFSFLLVVSQLTFSLRSDDSKAHLVFSSLCSLREAPFRLFLIHITPQTLQLDSWTLGSRRAVQQLALGTSTTVELDIVDSTLGFLL